MSDCSCLSVTIFKLFRLVIVLQIAAVRLWRNKPLNTKIATVVVKSALVTQLVLFLLISVILAPACKVCPCCCCCNIISCWFLRACCCCWNNWWCCRDSMSAVLPPSECDRLVRPFRGAVDGGVTLIESHPTFVVKLSSNRIQCELQSTLVTTERCFKTVFY